MNDAARMRLPNGARENVPDQKDTVKVPVPAANIKDIKLFLRSFGRKQPTLAFIDRTGKAKYKRITRRYPSVASAAAGAVYWNEAGYCCYFVGNSHRLPRLNDVGRTDTIHAPSRADIALAVGVWVDVDDPDPENARALNSRLDYPPTYIMFSGGGFQAHWRFEEPTEDIRAAEACALGMLREFADLPGIDARCWSAEHLWRLPGTINLKPGRNRITRLWHENWEARLPISAIAPETPPAIVQAAPVSFSIEGWTLETVKECLSDVAWNMLARRPSKYPSRSEHQFGFIGAVLSDGSDQYRIDLCAACLLATPADEFSVSHASYWEADGKPVRDPEAHVAQQIGNWLVKQGGNDGSE